MATANKFDEALLGLTDLERRNLKLAINPVKFAQSLGFDPCPWQTKFLHNKHSRIIMNCPRGAGKSLLSGIIALHHALYTPNAFVLMFSKSDRQGMELFRKARSYYQLGKAWDVRSIADTAHGLEFENGSRILSLPSTIETAIGYHDVTLLIIDEAGVAKEQLYIMARPMLDYKKGRLFLLSTPWGKSGFFYDAWRDWETNPNTYWDGITVTTDDCPYIDKGFLEEARQEMGEWWYSQQYECQFKESTDSFFSLEDIENAFSKEVKPLFDPVTGELDVPVPDKPIARGMISGLGWEI